jgi:hypothetical protein
VKKDSHVVVAKFRDKPSTQKISGNFACLNVGYLCYGMKKQHQILIVLLALLVLSSCARRKKGKGCDCPGFGLIDPDSSVQCTTSFRV